MCILNLQTHHQLRPCSEVQNAADPASLANNVKSLKGREGIRLRVGNWRVIMNDGEVLDVLDIGSRGSIYG